MDNGYETQGPLVLGVSIAFAVLTFVILCLRLFSRIYILGNMGVDDCMWCLYCTYLNLGNLLTGI